MRMINHSHSLPYLNSLFILGGFLIIRHPELILKSEKNKKLMCFENDLLVASISNY